MKQCPKEYESSWFKTRVKLQVFKLVKARVPKRLNGIRRSIREQQFRLKFNHIERKVVLLLHLKS